jgi:hypothetical protein
LISYSSGASWETGLWDNNQLVAEMLGGYMAGVTVSGVLWAVFKTTQVVLGIMPRNHLKQGF